jgi:L-histidine N-alpha-methyltransferase
MLKTAAPAVMEPALEADSPATDGLREEIRHGLLKPQKELPSRLLYDEAGAALFEVITLLPEYGLTRADQGLIQRHAGELAARLPAPVLVAELGSGSGRKTRPLLEALARRGAVRYTPIDISASALRRCRLELLENMERQNGAHPQAEFHGIHMVGLEGTYLEKLQEAARMREAGEGMLVLFLGSTIGNFDRTAARIFLWRIRGLMRRGDYLLLGADLEKSEASLLAAYDDALGVTAAFNRNLLRHVNRRWGADFDLSAYRHEARYSREQRRIEMHLTATVRQKVRLPGVLLEITLSPGESIWTESSHKFNPAELAMMAGASGFAPVQAWRDEEWPFSENLWQAV